MIRISKYFPFKSGRWYPINIKTWNCYVYSNEIGQDGEAGFWSGLNKYKEHPDRPSLSMLPAKQAKRMLDAGKIKVIGGIP